VTPTFVREPFEINVNASIVKHLESEVARTIQNVPTFTGQSFWTDAAILAAAGIKTVLVGPKGHGLHSEEEWVDVQSVIDLAHILAETACSYCI
jgi:acetylornithine deacetylase